MERDRLENRRRESLKRKLPGCQLFKCWYLPNNTTDVGQESRRRQKPETETEMKSHKSLSHLCNMHKESRI